MKDLIRKTLRCVALLAMGHPSCTGRLVETSAEDAAPVGRGEGGDGWARMDVRGAPQEDAVSMLEEGGAPDAGREDVLPGDAVATDAATDDVATSVGPFVPAPAGLKRLTRRQYIASLRDLLGSDVRIPNDLEVDTPLHGFSSIGAAQLTVSPRTAEQVEAAAFDVAQQVFGDASRRRALLGCTPASTGDACVTGFIARFGRRAWRRPLTMAEQARWVGVVGAVAPLYNDVWKGIEHAVAGMLQSPNFLYRVELGAPDPAHPARLRYTPWEMASRLSYFLWNTTPDDALLDAAEAGTLGTVEGVRAQVRRLLASPRAREAVGNFFTEYLKLDRLDTIARDPAVFPLMSPTLPTAMRAEVLGMLDAIVFARDADVREMFDTRATVLNDELARLYGLPFAAPTGPGGTLVPFTLPANGPRAGVLTTAALLTLNAHATETSPTLRGRFVRQFLLCQDIPPPPPGVTTTLPPPTAQPRTLRQRLEEHRSNPTCAGCHALMDPIGFGFEHFDSLGQYRTTDHGLPVDASGEIDGMRFRNAAELATLLRRHPRVGVCLSRQVYRHATSHLDTDGEAASLRDVGDTFARAGYRFRTLLEAIAVSDGFRYASPHGGM